MPSRAVAHAAAPGAARAVTQAHPGLRATAGAPADGAHIAQLPVELLVHIWSYLSMRDFPAVARTCQHWAVVTRAYLPRDLVRAPRAYPVLPSPPTIPRPPPRSALMCGATPRTSLAVTMWMTCLSTLSRAASSPPPSTSRARPVPRRWRLWLPCPCLIYWGLFLGHAGCHRVSEASLRNVVAGCPSLKVLRLSHLRLSSMSTWHLASYARNLDTLDLSHRYRRPPHTDGAGGRSVGLSGGCTNSDLGSTAVTWVCAPTLKRACLQGTTYPVRGEPVWYWTTFKALRAVEIAASEAVLRSLAALPSLVDVTFHGGDIRVTDENMGVFGRLRRLVLRGISVYSNYPIRPIWAALKDGAAATHTHTHTHTPYGSTCFELTRTHARAPALQCWRRRTP
jgi:hypothetical protein